jgi:hypothetical protein
MASMQKKQSLEEKHDILISSALDTDSQVTCGQIGGFDKDMQVSLGWLTVKQTSKPLPTQKTNTLDLAETPVRRNL